MNDKIIQIQIMQICNSIALSLLYTSCAMWVEKWEFVCVYSGFLIDT